MLAEALREFAGRGTEASVRRQDLKRVLDLLKDDEVAADPAQSGPAASLHALLHSYFALDEDAFRERFRGRAIQRAKRDGLLRNACVVAGNAGEASLLPALARLAAHDSALVRAHAVWAVRRIAGAGAGEWLAAAREKETDAAVLAEYAN